MPGLSPTTPGSTVASSPTGRSARGVPGAAADHPGLLHLRRHQCRVAPIGRPGGACRPGRPWPRRARSTRRSMRSRISRASTARPSTTSSTGPTRSTPQRLSRRDELGSGHRSRDTRRREAGPAPGRRELTEPPRRSLGGAPPRSSRSPRRPRTGRRRASRLAFRAARVLRLRRSQGPRTGGGDARAVGPSADATGEFREPRWARFLFAGTVAAWLWLVVRVYVASVFLPGGLGEDHRAASGCSATARRSRASSAGAIQSPDTPGWYVWFLQNVVQPNAEPLRDPRRARRVRGRARRCSSGC